MCHVLFTCPSCPFKPFFLKSTSDLPKQDKMVFLLKLSMLAEKEYPFLSAISDGQID